MSGIRALCMMDLCDWYDDYSGDGLRDCKMGWKMNCRVAYGVYRKIDHRRIIRQITG